MNRLQNTNKIFEHARINKYAIGAFNFVNMEMLKSILTTAEKEKSAVIIQCSTGAIKYAGAKTLVAMTNAIVEDLSIPVCLNLDHGKTFEDCVVAIDSGFTNVMIDASSLPYEENILLTKKVVDYAHSKGVTVEAELGVLCGVEEEVSCEMHIYTDPNQVLDFVTRTNVDSLAIAIGTSHGTHKFKGDAKLQFEILEEIEKLLPTFPLVLHGASSVPVHLLSIANQYGVSLEGANGVPEEMLQIASAHNICKINVDSDLKLAYTTGLRKYLSENPENIDLRKYNGEAMKFVAEEIEHKLKNVFMSARKY